MRKKPYNKNRKKIWIPIFLGFVALALMVHYSTNYISKQITDVKAAEFNHGVAMNNQIPSETGEKGTAANPFVILEIVPYEGYAEIGYLIDGCEPVDISKMLTDSDAIMTIDSFKGATVSKSVEHIKFELDEKDVPSEWQYITNDTKTLKGYYERVADGTGKFVQNVTEYEYKKVADGTGNFKKVDSYSKKELWEAGDNYAVAFVYNKSVTGVQRYSISNVTSPTDSWYYKYYNRDSNGNYVFSESGTDTYAGTGQYNVTFIPDDKGDYIVAKSKLVGNVEQMKSAIYGKKDAYLKASNGDYEQAIKNATYTKASKGNFNWVTVEDLDLTKVGTNHNADKIGDKVYTTRSDNYFRSYRHKYTNNNLFLKNVLHISEDKIPNYHVVVKTIQPSELNNNTGWIDRSDLIYINPKTHMQPLVTIWGKYNRLGKKPPTSYATKFNLSEDLNWAATMAIFNKVVVAKDYAGIIIDATTYDPSGPTDSAKNGIESFQFGKDANGNVTTYQNDTLQGNLNNIYKLCLMLRTMDPLVFYNLYLNDNGGTVTPLITQTTVNGKTTGFYGRQPNYDARIYWTVQTFMPTKPDGSRAFYNDWLNMWNTYKCNPIMEGNTSVIGRIYTYNGDNSLTIEFSTGKINYDAKFTKELHDYITEQGGNSSSAGPSKAVEYILGYEGSEQKKESITVLNLEPCNDFKLTVQDVRAMLLSYSGIINIKRQTSAEFIGKIEDLNKEYDMIYMGLNFGAFHNSGGKTIYNDNTLNGKIYLHVGDRIRSTQGFTNWGIPTANSNDIRLSGNDLTKLKRDDLLHYMKAGYPIVTSDGFLNGTSVNTSVIDVNSNIYDFVNNQKNKSNFFTKSTAINNNTALMSALSIVKPSIKLISKPVEYSVGVNAAAIELADPKNYINGSNSSNRDLDFRFQIKDGTTISSPYKAKIYVDANADGKFADIEEQCSEICYSGDTVHTIKKTLHETYFGIIPWKLAVYNIANPEIRTEVTGYSAVMKKNEDKETIKVLQINRNSNSNLNLEKDGVFSQYIEYLNDFNIDFTTITVSDFEKLYNSTKNETLTNDKISDTITKQYIKSDPTTDRLANYNMIILGFGDSYGNISNTNRALNNLSDYILAGKSVLCSHDNTSYHINDNFNLLFRGMLGMDRYGVRNDTALIKVDSKYIDYTPYANQKQGYTYYMAMRFMNNDSTQYKAYKNMKSINMGSAHCTSQVSKLNAGQLTTYPYMIRDTFSCGDTHSQYYQLNLEDPDIVVWYTLDYDSTDKVNMYIDSPNDAANNYYIYNKGNITYTGMGHAPITSPGNVKIDEVKLFVNTIVASYKAGLKAPSITVNDAIRINGNEYNKYLDLDPNDTTFGVGDMQKVEFSVTDFNLLSAQYTSDDLGVIVTLEDGTPLKIYSAIDDIEVVSKISQVDNPSINLNRLKNRKTYYVLYPMSAFGSAESKKIVIYAENYKGLSTSASVNFIRRTLFDLD